MGCQEHQAEMDTGRSTGGAGYLSEANGLPNASPKTNHTKIECTASQLASQLMMKKNRRHDEVEARETISTSPLGQCQAKNNKNQIAPPSRELSVSKLTTESKTTTTTTSMQQGSPRVAPLQATPATTATLQNALSGSKKDSAAVIMHTRDMLKKFTVDCYLYMIRALITTYDLLSQPVYYFRHGVARRRREVEHLRSRKVNPEDPESPWRQVDIPPHQVEIERRIDSFDTYDQMMRQSFKENAECQCYGYRQVLEESFSKKPDQPEKLIRQVKLSDYKWCTYGQFEAQIETARKGLLKDGVRAGQRAIIFADTRAEWQICTQALIRLGAIVGTMYSTLGVDGIVHTINETQATLVITQRDKVGRLLKLSPKLPKLSRVIYFETSLFLPRSLGGRDPEDEHRFLAATESHFDMAAERLENVNHIECLSFCKLIKSGLEVGPNELETLEQENNKFQMASGGRHKDSVAVIMYTSGSTGIPKGVLISHGNIMATVKSFSYVTKDFIHNPKENTCTAYLPLAHIFEFCIESVMLYHGVRFGFASPHTLTDKSPGLAPGETGDLVKLQPTIMIIVPLILDRIVQGVKQALKAQSYFHEQLVSYLIEYKSYWQQRQYETPLVDKLICSKMAVALGGRAKYVICGSAPLSSQTQTFVRAALNLKLPQGFGTTETCAATACQLFDDHSTSNVGLPVSGAQIKLEPWIEGNYRPSDKPNPRGEIVVGGQMIAHGYYNLEEATREAFYVDEQGVRWYRTGDIGEFLPNGQLKIIDRKKDLVKLQNGEYISLGRVESNLKSNPYTDNFCVYANSNYNYVIALGPANELSMRTLAQQIVDESEGKVSPSMAKRLGGYASNVNSSSSSSSSSPISILSSKEEKELLLTQQQDCISDHQRELALAELKEVLESYETDLLNNNNNNNNNATLNAADRRGSLASSNEQQTTPTSTQHHQLNVESGEGGVGTAATKTGGDEPLPSCINERLQRLCKNKLTQERVLAYIHRMAKERNLLSLEVPRKLLLLAEEWTEDKNLVTAALKIRRNFVYKRYEHELEQIYAGDGV